MRTIDIHKDKKVAIFAPASMGNTSISYDLVGTAIVPISGELLGDTVTVSLNHDDDGNKVMVLGDFAHLVPSDGSNLAELGLNIFHEKLEQKDIKQENIMLTLYKNLAIGTGLGSSACSVVATIEALNRFYDYPFTKDEALQIMAILEGNVSGAVHYDNIAPAYLGGMIIVDTNKPQNMINIPYNKEWFLTVCYNGQKISTAMARSILPKDYPKDTAVQNALNLGLFIHNCHIKDYHKALEYMDEIIAEPHRKSLIDDYDLAHDKCLAYGGLNFGISGSGPTVFGVFDDQEKANEFNLWLEKNFIKNQMGSTNVCKISANGVQIITDMENHTNDIL